MTTTQQTVRDVEQQSAPGQGPDDEFIHHDHIGHGSTPAAWALSLTIIAGSVIAGVGFVTEWWILVWIGAAFLPLAIILGVGLKRAGYGVEMDSKAVLDQGEDPRSHQGPVLDHHPTGEGRAGKGSARR